MILLIFMFQEDVPNGKDANDNVEISKSGKIQI